MASAHDFAFRTLGGEPFPLKDLAGKPLLVVNTASKCGFTPQYRGLEDVWTEYRARGLMVIGVPSNDFGSQEPGSEAEIGAFCEQNYGVDFPLTGKVHVRGAQAHPFFKWIGEQGGFMAKPKWNFFKYVIGKDGGFVTWFSSLTPPSAASVRRAIEGAL
jgi:glutathione peroxidase